MKALLIWLGNSLTRTLKLMVISQRYGRTREIRLPHVVIALFVLGLAALVGGNVYQNWLLRQHTTDVAENRELKNQLFMQSIKMRNIAREVERFGEEMVELQELDHQLRVIADLEITPALPPFYGTGGAADQQEQILEEVGLEDLDFLSLLQQDLRHVRQQSAQREESFHDLKIFLSNNQDLLQRTPYRKPLRGFISSGFGMRNDPFTGLKRFHRGIDIVAPAGTPIHTPADGIVTQVASDPHLGLMVAIDHGNGTTTRYGHNRRLLVREGQRVERGMPIAEVGSTGRSTGPHLHYEIRIDGVPVNPYKYFANRP